MVIYMNYFKCWNENITTNISLDNYRITIGIWKEKEWEIEVIGFNKDDEEMEKCLNLTQLS